MADCSGFDPDRLLSHKFPEASYTYTERDVALYALGIGACGRDAVDTDELKYVYHENGQQFVQVLPTFAALFSLGSLPNGFHLPGLQFDPRLLLHGQQYIEIYKPFPSNASILNKVCLAGLHDKGLYPLVETLLNKKLAFACVRLQRESLNEAINGVQISCFGLLSDLGKAAILELETKSYEKTSGELLCKNRMTVYLRGAGGFSKSSHPYSYSNYPANQVTSVKIPKGQPFALFEDCTQLSQALLYRLSGDYNPLHSDPMLAKVAGFSRPILHGLCTLGYAVRAIIKCICRGDPNMVKSISGRFLLHVYPGETLITEMWLEGLRVIYQTTVKERNRTVLSGYVDLHRLASSL